MQIVEADTPFTFYYAAFSEETGLEVAALVYDVTTGSAVLLGTVAMAHQAFGVYSGNYTGEAGSTYLVICAIYTSSAYTTPTSDAAAAFEFQCAAGEVTFLAFDYTDYAQSASLHLATKVFDTSTGTPSLVGTVTMTYVALGCYLGTFTGTVGSTYLMAKAVFTDSGHTILDPLHAPAGDTFVCITLGGVESVDPGTGNVRRLVAYEINGVPKVGTLYVDDPTTRLRLGARLYGAPLGAQIKTSSDSSVRLGASLFVSQNLCGRAIVLL
jgi:hypothetical protein